MPTPVEWLGNYQVNIFGEATGGQSDPHIIGLSSGNFLVAWTEAADGAIAGDKAGTDIIAKIYNAEGTVVRNAYRLNVDTLNDEGDFDIAATNDGGFVLVYREDETAIQGNNASSIHWGQFSAAGNSTDGALIASEAVAADFLGNPQITVDLLTNQSIITFSDDVGADTDVRGITVNEFGFVGAEFDAANNSAGFDGNGDVAILANGDIVSVYEEDDGAVRGIEFKIFDNAGGFVTAALNVSSGENRAPKVATLLNGNFVVVYHASDSENGNIEFQIFAPDGSPLFGPFNAANGADNQNEPNVVALPDGDFLIAWDNETDGTLEARRLNSDGTLDAGTFTVVDDNVAEIDLGLTGDGRVLFTWRDGEIFASIWDPRDNVLAVSDYNLDARNFLNSTAITALLTDTTITSGPPGNFFFGATLLGQAGDDVLTGDLQAAQFIDGGGGDDTIAGLGGADELDGGSGVDTLDYSASPEAVDVRINAEFGNKGGDAGGPAHESQGDQLSGFEIMIGSDFDDTLDANGFVTTLMQVSSEDRLTGDLPAAQNMLGGDGDDTIFATGLLKGERGDDSLAGSSDADTIFGGVGADIALGGGGGDSIQGGGGSDTLFGDAGEDTIFGDDATPTSSFADSIDGGAGEDSLTGAASADTIFGGADADTIVGRGGADILDGGAGDFIVDTVDYSSSSAAVSVLLNSSANSGGDAEGDALSGFEIVIGSDFNDTLDANDLVFASLQGGLGNDLIFAGDSAVIGSARTGRGGDGRDTLFGGTRDDILFGDGGKDSLDSGSGNDQLSGGGSDDTLNGGRSGDVLDGGGGIDTADYSGATEAVFADLEVTGQNAGDAAGDSYISIENLLGSQFEDILRGDALANMVEGAAGNDDLRARAGNDTLTGGTGKDTLDGDSGADQFNLETSGAAGDADDIVDFAAADILALDSDAFGLAEGALTKSRFVVGTEAQDGNDRLIYNPANGRLFFDPDGHGAEAQVRIATLTNLPVLDVSDFVVI